MMKNRIFYIALNHLSKIYLLILKGENSKFTVISLVDTTLTNMLTLPTMGQIDKCLVIWCMENIHHFCGITAKNVYLNPSMRKYRTHTHIPKYDTLQNCKRHARQRKIEELSQIKGNERKMTKCNTWCWIRQWTRKKMFLLWQYWDKL